jgi:hypothetical protein
VSADPFAVGSTVVQRHVLDGPVISAYPCRAVASRPCLADPALPPGSWLRPGTFW